MRAQAPPIEDKKRLVAEVEALLAGGQSMVDACKQVGLPYSSYYHKYKHQIAGNNLAPKTPPKPLKRGKPKSKAYLKEIETPPAQSKKVVCLIGSPEEISNILRGGF